MTTSETRTARAAEGIAGERLPAVSCKRKDILRLDHDAYSSHADAVARDSLRQLSSSTSTTCSPPGTCRTALSLFQWLRSSPCSVPRPPPTRPGKRSPVGTGAESLGELYGGAIETRFARDVQELVGWIKGSPIEPKTISDSNFAASRLLTLRTRNSAALQGPSCITDERRVP